MKPIKTALAILGDAKQLPTGLMTQVMHQIMDGDATAAQIGALLMASKIHGDSVATITEAAKVMRARATKVVIDAEYIVDTCGTGGDGIGLFNVSTGAAVIAAAAGCTVAKHGNRSVSSTTGSADVLEAAGVNLALNASQVADCIQQCGIGFLFAPAHHAATRFAVAPRKEIGLRTFFNLLGPLTNPASAPNQVVGVFAKDWMLKTAKVLHNLGSRHVMVVFSEDGMDEISIAAKTYVVELKHGNITEYSIAPEDFGLTAQACDSLIVQSAAASLTLINQAFSTGTGTAADILALNAGAAIYVAGKADSMQEGVKLAQNVLQSGAVADKFKQLIEMTHV
ncbi:MAG: anthranilate phosphoribosyltransferase [Proteobacteria bacterium]|nr:anthranilate phosphoribosyltransferase [Pseudomonadota bacterium]